MAPRRILGLSVALLSTLALAGTATSCKPGVVAGAAKAPAVPDNECDPKALSGVVSPLVLEWPASARSDLEAAAQEGVVVVSFTCTGVKVLADCKVKGGYGYRSVTARTETTLIEGKDDIKASFGGAAWAVAGSLTRDAKLDLTTLSVGKLSTARSSVHRSDLADDDFCKGATHFVKRIDLGAFAMATGTNVSAGFSAKAFTQGAAGGSSSKDVRTKADGDPNKCKVSATSDAKAPEGCGAPIRVSLAPIKEGKASKSESLSAGGGGDGLGCPTGFVFVEGACLSHAPKDKGVLCKEDDPVGCLAECKKGSDESCNRYANWLMYDGSKGKKDDETTTLILAVKKEFEAACKADQATACAALGAEIFFRAMAGKEPDPKLVNEAMVYMEASCVAGEFEACGLMRILAGPGMKEHLGKDYGDLLMKAATRGCKAGNAAPCAFLAFETAEKNDPAKAAEYADKACTGSVAEACLLLAGLNSDHEPCIELWNASDKLHDQYAAGDLCLKRLPLNDKVAKASAARACELGQCLKK